MLQFHTEWSSDLACAGVPSTRAALSFATQRLEEQLASLEQRLSRPRAHVTAEGALAAVPAGASDAAQRAMPPYEQPALLSTTAALQPSAVANRLTDRSALAALAPGPAKSTWEGDKTRALLALEDRLSKLQGQNQQNTDDKENKATDTIPARHNTTSTQPPLIITLHAGSGHKAHSHVDTVLHARAGAAPAVLARGAAASAGANAWERGQSQAILALERERDTLAAQLSQYAHLNAIHQRQLMAAHAHHARALEDAQVGQSSALPAGRFLACYDALFTQCSAEPISLCMCACVCAGCGRS